MNAIQLIQRHGVQRAKENLPAYERLYCGPKQLFVVELKRLVESIDLIKSYGGIINAKMDIRYLDIDWDYDSPRRSALKQAIADYEAIYFEIGDLVVCTDDGLEAEYLTVKKITGFIDDWGLELNDGEHWVNTYRFRRATAEEETAGHRIDLEELRDCDTSPNCKKIDLEQVNSND
ncbi:hypothetical protein MN869_09460 [Acinetobacter sp. NIPH1876]|uniref:hypothetical protein n=1 Tax=Acinetobacter sp. NIPH1876 TaxID=2924041 RepID=UPI001FAC0E18|nr:hypothetical protein [Acinetobacter sp. NIPH1876]MCJ0828673.1 hypothetical protein [Acinetobacter sp. NIPH1876]